MKRAYEVAGLAVPAARAPSTTLHPDFALPEEWVG